MLEQSLLYVYMTSKLQRVGYHGIRFYFVKLKCLKNAHYEQGGYIVCVLIINLEEYLVRQKLWQIRVDMIYDEIQSQEQVPRNEYQYNAATRINEYTVSKNKPWK